MIFTTDMHCQDWMPLYARGLSTTTSEQERLRQDVNRKLDKLRDAVHTVDTDGGEKIQGERVEREEKARLEKNAEKVQKLHLRAIALEGLARHVTESRDRNLLVQHGFLALVFRLVYANSGLGGRFGEALVEGRLTPVEQRDALYVLVKLAQHGNSSLPACEAHRIRPVEEYLLESYLSDFKTDDTRDTRPGVGAMWGKGGGIAPIKALMLQVTRACERIRTQVCGKDQSMMTLHRQLCKTICPCLLIPAHTCMFATG